jgi:hypothetical protein
MCFSEHLILLLSALEWSDPQQQWPHTEMFLQNKTCANTSLHILGVQKWQRIQNWWTSWQWSAPSYCSWHLWSWVFDYHFQTRERQL